MIKYEGKAGPISYSIFDGAYIQFGVGQNVRNKKIMRICKEDNWNMAININVRDKRIIE